MGQPVKGIHFITIARAAGSVILASSGTSCGGGAATTS